MRKLFSFDDVIIWNSLHFDSNFTEISSQGFISQKASISADNGFDAE